MTVLKKLSQNSNPILRVKEHGFLSVDKPAGMTSFQVVRIVKRHLTEKKIGHAGTLDPLATGLLILAIGRQYTRQISTIQDLEKEYEVEIKLGVGTDTDDADGAITNDSKLSVTDDQIKEAILLFVGKLDQMPPQFSAKKVGGKRAYKLARAGETVDLKPSQVVVHSIEILSIKNGEFPILHLKITCSKGTYIRSLARDIGEKLGSFGHVVTLKRTKIGHFSVSDSISLDDITPEKIKSALIKKI